MRIVYSSDVNSSPANVALQKDLRSVSEKELKDIVDEIAIPRHFEFNSKNNKFVAERIFSRFAALGYETYFQGNYSNIVALNPDTVSRPQILIGAHYDSVPNCPGADDNASAIASLIVCAKMISKFAAHIPVCFVAFNCEEDGFIGSRDFVSKHLPETKLKIEEAHILEMIGYATEEPNTQKAPPGLPVKIPSVGNFLGILGNQRSNYLVDNVLASGKSYIPELPVIGLKLYLGLENLLPDFGRSDHVPFWEKRIPALMWTDTANFRNPNYHKFTDTPDTLNYSFLRKVTQLLLFQIMNKVDI